MNDFEIGSTISWQGTGAGEYYLDPEIARLITADLIYTGHDTVYLYPADDPGNTNSYPYVVLRPGRYAEYRTGYNNYQTITNATMVQFSPVAMFYREWSYIQPVLLMIIAFSCLVRIFKR